jgi:hypothetical protein
MSAVSGQIFSITAESGKSLACGIAEGWQLLARIEAPQLLRQFSGSLVGGIL